MENDLFSLKDEIAVVVGGTGTLGGEMAEALAHAGARVAVVGRSEERGRERVRRITGSRRSGRLPVRRRPGPRFADPGPRRHCGASVGHGECARQRGGRQPARCDLAARPLDFCRLPLDAWQGVFDLNLVGGVLLPCQVFGDTHARGRERHASSTLASMAGMIPLSRVVAYSAAKAAVINLTKFLARRVGPTRRAASTPSVPASFPPSRIAPCYCSRKTVVTPRCVAARITRPHTDGPFRRGTFYELARQHRRVAGGRERASSFVTGQNIVVDGGFLGRNHIAPAFGPAHGRDRTAANVTRDPARQAGPICRMHAYVIWGAFMSGFAHSIRIPVNALLIFSPCEQLVHRLDPGVIPFRAHCDSSTFM